MPIHLLASVPFGVAALPFFGGREELSIQPLLHVVIAGDFGQIGPALQGSVALVGEIDLSISRFLASEAAFVDEVMMAPAERHEIIQTGLTAIGPVFDVMSIDEFGVGAARKAATPVANT